HTYALRPSPTRCSSDLDDGSGQRGIGLAARADPERHGEEADERGQARHEDGAEPSPAALDHGLAEGQALPPQLVHVLDEQDAIRYRKSARSNTSHERIS